MTASVLVVVPWEIENPFVVLLMVARNSLDDSVLKTSKLADAYL